MLVLHGFWSTANGLCLWAEDSDLTVKSPKPVVVVGAMRNAGAPGYEGPANLLDAFRVAASPESRGKGVLVVLNDRAALWGAAHCAAFDES